MPVRKYEMTVSGPDRIWSAWKGNGATPKETKKGLRLIHVC